jgi:three-Cys-motif partner protein
MLNDVISTQTQTSAVDSDSQMSPYVDENPDYWQEYNNLQRVKHQLLKHYLGGWFPILGSWSGRIVYIDCHAGRGRHQTGQAGSPLIALETFLNHPQRDRILKKSEALFFFIEADEQNKETLKRNLANYKRPHKVFVSIEHGDFQRVLQDGINQLCEQKSAMAPAFIFVDPYGFALPGKLLAELKAFERCELFITFMWRWIDMAIRNPLLAENMDALFVTPDWRNLTGIQNPDERCEAAIRLLCKQLGAKYFTRVKMLGEHVETKYVLIHATSHLKGRELMLGAMWKICPTGGFKVRVNDNPDQEFLIKPEPNLESLKQWLWDKYKNKTVSLGEIYSTLAEETFYLKTHLHQVLKELHGNDEISAPEKLVFSQNPQISFAPRRKKQLRKR